MFPFSRRMGETAAGYGQQRTREQTLREHNSALKELRSDLSKGPGFHLPSVAMRKRPEPFGLVSRMESCTPISIRELEPGRTHRGAVIKGCLTTEAIKMQSVQSVLEDEAGDVITVHMYNVPSLPPTMTTSAILKAAQNHFPEGQGLAIIEPFYKIMLDGTPGVRVDNPAEIIFLDEQGKPLRSAAEIPDVDSSSSDRRSNSGSSSSDVKSPGWSRPIGLGSADSRPAKTPSQRRSSGRPNKSKKSHMGKKGQGR